MHPCISHRITARYPPDEPGQIKYIEELLAATDERKMKAKEGDIYSLLLQGYDMDCLESRYFGHWEGSSTHGQRKTGRNGRQFRAGVM